MDPAVTLLLETLNDDIVSTSKKLSGVRDQLDTLRDDLSYYKVVLESWTENPIEHEQQKQLVKQLREEVYGAHAILADLVAEETKHKSKNVIRRIAHLSDHPTKLLAAVNKIHSMREKVEEIHERKINPDGQGSSNTCLHPRLMVPEEVETENVVGLVGEAETVIKLLTEGSGDLEVISITGMPGLGKTTLARMIFHDSKIEYEFYNRAWVSVSKDCNIREVFLQILGHFTKVTDEMQAMAIDELSEEVKRILARERYLIVMDDVWEVKDWNALQKVFPNSKKNSRILMTSRNESVANHANPDIPPHKLKFLSAEESLELLHIKAFGSRNCPYKELETPGWEIALECGGLPLAIVIIGGILRKKGVETVGTWIDVSKNVKAHINMDPEETMKKIIALSFYELPYSSKACFLYFGMFPKDSQVLVRQLIHMWIAEGFIERIQCKDIGLEDIAEEYLEDLVNRNLVIVGKLRSNGKIKTCHVHEMVREFCINMAAEENLYHEIKQFDPSTNPEFKEYRRICIHSRVLDYLDSKSSIGARVRSFSCSSSEKIYLQWQHISWILKVFKSLRVLNGKPITFPQFPRDLAQLAHLTYLVLSIKDKIVPGVIFDLRNLQTLIVYTSSHTLEIKGDTWKTSRLRHLESNASLSWEALSKAKKKKEGLGTNEYLTTLSTISPETCTKNAFKRVPNINKLGIRGQLAKILNGKDSSCSFDNLMKLESLENLKLINDVLGLSFRESEIIRLPDRFPPHMKKLTLTNTQLDWSNMSILGKLGYLEILKLKENAFKGALWKPNDGEFPALKVLHIGRTDIVFLEASDCHFANLEHLSLSHCTELRQFQLSLPSISSLQTVELFWTTASAAASIKKIYNEKNNQGKGFKLSIYPPDLGL